MLMLQTIIHLKFILCVLRRTMAKLAFFEPRSASLLWKKWVRDSDPAVYKGCVVFLVAIYYLLCGGEEHFRGMMERGVAGAGELARRGGKNMATWSGRSGTVLVTSLLAQLWVLLGRSMSFYSNHDPGLTGSSDPFLSTLFPYSGGDFCFEHLWTGWTCPITLVDCVAVLTLQLIRMAVHLWRYAQQYSEINFIILWSSGSLPNKHYRHVSFQLRLPDILSLKKHMYLFCSRLYSYQQTCRKCMVENITQTLLSFRVCWSDAKTSVAEITASPWTSLRSICKTVIMNTNPRSFLKNCGYFVFSRLTTCYLVGKIMTVSTKSRWNYGAKKVTKTVSSLRTKFCSRRGSTALRLVVMIVFVNQMLLMLAGDVERNPGPVPPSLKELMDDLAPVSFKWFELGIHLGFSVGDLNVIEHDNPHSSSSDCMMSMLKRKLRTSFELGCSEVIQALHKINESALAERIKQKHYPQPSSASPHTSHSPSVLSARPTMDTTTGEDVHEDISKNIYDNEMEHGYIDLGIDKIVVFGIGGSGKTCSIATLLGLEAPKEHISTPLMEKPIEVIVISLDNKKKWKKLTPDEVQQIIANIIKSREESPTMPEAGENSSKEVLPIQLSNPPSEPTNTHDLAENRSDQCAESELDKILQSLEDDKEWISLIQQSNPSSEPIHKHDLVYVIDSGGQQQFHEVLPTFLNGATYFLYVFKINEDLNSKPAIRYSVKDEEPIPLPSLLTNQEIFEQCMHTMYSFTTTSKDSVITGSSETKEQNSENEHICPKILIIGTHRDKVEKKDLSAVLEDLQKEMKPVILPIKDQVQYDQTQTNFIFPINAQNLEGDEETKHVADAIRTCINNTLSKRRVKVPLRWYALKYRLEEVKNKLKRTVWRRNECQEVADTLKIDHNSCEEALKFFHSLNLLFYFPNILPKLVFLEPQVILNKVSELVKQSVVMRGPSNHSHLVVTGGNWSQFKDYGKVTKEMLGEFKSHYDPPTFTEEHVIKLFKDLLVFAELSPKSWFMPSLLEMKSNITHEDRLSGKGALAIQFSYDHQSSPCDRQISPSQKKPLNGMFCCMVAFTLSSENKNPCAWKIAIDCDEEQPICLKRNIMTLNIPNYPGFVTLIDCCTHFEAHVKTSPKREEEVWKWVQQSVEAGLKKACDILNYTKCSSTFTILCPKHYPSPNSSGPTHTVHLEKLQVSSEFTCPYGEFGEAPEEVRWLKLLYPAGSPSSPDDCCTVASPDFQMFGKPDSTNTLMNLVGVKVKAKWEAIGDGLGIEQGDMSAFKTDNSYKENAAQHCMHAVFNKWKSAKTSEYSWQNLADVLSSPAVDEIYEVEQLHDALSKAPRL